MDTNEKLGELEQRLEKVGIGRYKRHIFLCAGEKCCSRAEGEAVWNYLKRRCQELGLVNESVYRTKAHCLRVCLHGPVAVVYPEGVWYGQIDQDTCEKIIQEHLIEGKVVESAVIAKYTD